MEVECENEVECLMCMEWFKESECIEVNLEYALCSEQCKKLKQYDDDGPANR